MNQITNPEDAARLLEQERLQRLERRREINRRYMAKKRAEDPEAARQRMREYMRNSGAALNYYHRNREAISIKKHEYYKRKKAEEDDACRLAAISQL